MRLLKDLATIIANKVEFTNLEQNEDTSLGMVIETILMGRNKGRRDRFIKQFELTDEEVKLLEANTLYFYE
jgi:hypothetical protein